MINDTKQYWKRRALLAEAKADSLSKARRTDHSMEMTMHAEIGRLHVAMAEIQSAINFAASKE